MCEVHCIILTHNYNTLKNIECKFLLAFSFYKNTCTFDMCNI